LSGNPILPPKSVLKALVMKRDKLDRSYLKVLTTHFAAEAVIRGGIPIVEITMTVPGAMELMAHLVRSDPKIIVGAGTVLCTDTARLCGGLPQSRKY
jgi:hypothetical protein